MSINITVTPTIGGEFPSACSAAESLNLTIGAGFGPPGVGDVAIAPGDGISIVTVANVATITNTRASVSTSTLGDLSDVFLTGATAGQVLEWNGTHWAAGIDSTLALATLGGADLGVAAAGNSTEAARSDHVHNVPALADLSGVFLNAPTTGEVLGYNGTAWASVSSIAAQLSSDPASDLGAAAAGNASVAARADHVHNLPTFADITNGTASVNGTLTLNASSGSVVVSGGNASASLTLNCEQNTHGVKIQSPPHSSAANYTLTLPDSAGSANQTLATDGTGKLSWRDAAAGGVTWAAQPLSTNSTGNAGDIAYGSGFFYLHDGSQWRRTAMTGWFAPQITISSQPETLLLNPGDSGSFSVTATVSDNSQPAYQWQRKLYGEQAWSDLSGQVGASYTVASAAYADNSSQYRVVVSAFGADNASSNAALLLVGNVSTGYLLTEAGDNITTEAGDRLVYADITYPTASWSQLGGDVFGATTTDVFGAGLDLSRDGTTFVAGSSFSDGGGLSAGSGHASVYYWSGSAWTQRGSDINAAASGDGAWRVAVNSDGTTVAVGATGFDGGGTDRGHVRVFGWSGTAWGQIGSDLVGGGDYDYFGASVSLNDLGDVVAIGATHADPAGTQSGEVSVYSWTGSAWSQLGSSIAGQAAGDECGYSVALDSTGTVLAVGSPLNDDSDINAGSVRVYQWTGSAWSQMGADIDGAVTAYNMGRSVALSSDGTTLAVGGVSSPGTGANAGRVSVYSWTGSSWVPFGSDIVGLSGDELGRSVSLSSDGQTLAIGAPYRDNPATGTLTPDEGAVLVYYWSGSAWVQRGGDLYADRQDEHLGTHARISGDGLTLAAAAPQSRGVVEGGSEPDGQVKVFVWS